MGATYFQGLKGRSVAVSADYVCNGSEACVRVTAGATDKTVTLPAANSGPQIVMVEKADAGVGVVTVNPAGTDTVSGGAGLPAQRDAIVYMSDGATNWQRLA